MKVKCDTYVIKKRRLKLPSQPEPYQHFNELSQVRKYNHWLFSLSLCLYLCIFNSRISRDWILLSKECSFNFTFCPIQFHFKFYIVNLISKCLENMKIYDSSSAQISKLEKNRRKLFEKIVSAGILVLTLLDNAIQGGDLLFAIPSRCKCHCSWMRNDFLHPRGYIL